MTRRSFYFIGIGILLLFVPVTFSESIRNSNSKLFGPVGHYFYTQQLGIRSFFTNLSQVGSLRDEKNQLQSEVLKLQQEVSRLENIERENSSLRKELGVVGIIKDTEKVFARIIIQGSDPLDRSFTISAGSDQGLAVGQPVVHQGFLVGKVTTVRKDSAVVRSVVSPKSIVQAWTPGNQELGLLVGDGNTVSFKEVDQGKTIVTGSPVETSGLSGGVAGSLPQGIALGVIGEISSSPNDLKQSFRVTLGIDPASIKDVLVLIIPTQ